MAAAGDRHLAEFMDQEDYLRSPEQVQEFMFALTPVSWRKNEKIKRLERSQRLKSGEEEYQLRNTGEEGARQIRALLGLGDFVTNINLPNAGQIPNLPMGVIVETNAAFRSDGFRAVHAGEVPQSIYPMIRRAAQENEDMLDAAFSLDLRVAYDKFAKLNMLKALSEDQKKALFDEMIQGTKNYLQEYR